MPTVVAAVVCRGHAFSSDATAHVVGDVGAGCDGPPRLFGCRALMIAHARTPVLVGDGRRCLQLMRAARTILGAWLP
jgi:hypothetical protein